MSIRCPKCGREYDVTLFEYGRDVTCPCGEVISLRDGHRVDVGINWESLEREIFGAVNARQHDRKRAEEFRREADKIASMILYSDMPRVDIEIAIGSFRERVLAIFPEKGELFEAIYVNRFRRLWSQFRGGRESLFENTD